MIFNEEQNKAINHGAGPAMIVAGPGSGKTAVITARANRLVSQGLVKPENLLVITFTKAAAEEMKRRYLKQVSPSEYGVCFGTFHAVFFMILRESAGIAQDALIKPSEQYRLIYSALAAAEPGRSYSAEELKYILGEIGRRKSSPTGTGTSSLPCSEAVFERIYRDYCKALRERGRIDFDDILLRCRELLQSNAGIRRKWQERFRYIMIDEFQDINPVQYDTIRLLAAPTDNLVAVGDDDQSIYAFRGASPGLVDRFAEDYPAAECIMLTRNYRSASAITGAAEKVIGNNLHRKNKRIKADSGKKGSVEIIETEDRRDEHRQLAELLCERINGGAEYSDCAILFRTNAGVRGLTEILTDHKIPYELRESPPDLLSNHITRDLLAFMKLAEADDSREHYLRICNKPYRGISRDCFPKDRVNPAECLARLKNPVKKQLEHFFGDISVMRGLDPHTVILFARRAMGYDAYLREYAGLHACDETEIFERLEDITATASGMHNAEEWEEKLKSYSDESRKNKAELPGVKLMTFHASKGLEFKHVYIIDLNEGVVPLGHATEAEAVEEERRTVYVAMTRAEESLTLMYVKKRGGRYVQPSRFVLEVKNDMSAKISAVYN